MGKEIYDRDKDPEVIKVRTELFNKYVAPYVNMIYKLCINYTDCKEDVEENYTEVLTNFYRSIETYDTSRSICTWLHIVTKRYVFQLNKRRYKRQVSDREAIDEMCYLGYGQETYDIDHSSEELSNKNIIDLCGDEVVKAMQQLKPIYKRPLLLKLAGYSVKEIADREHELGALDSYNLNTIKSRLFLAYKALRKELNNGQH